MRYSHGVKSLLRPRRRCRLRLTLLAIVALLFQQAALASYVCAQPVVPSGNMAMSEHCTGMPMTQAKHAPALCAWHCGQLTASTQNVQSPSVPPLILPGLLPAAPALVAGLRGTHVSRSHDAVLRSSGIPRALRFRVLLI